MASDVYPEFVLATLTDNVGYSLDGNVDLKAALVDTTTGGTVTTARSFNAAHIYWSDFAPSLSVDTADEANGVISIVSLTNVSVTRTSGTLVSISCSDPIFSAVSSYNSGTGSIDAIVIYHSTGANNTSRMISWLESDLVAGLPITPDGDDILVSLPGGGFVVF